MNTDLLLQLKREFQILVEQMKTVFCSQEETKQHAYNILQFKVPLANLQSRLQAELQNHVSFGSLDQFQIIWADEDQKQKWYQKREQQEQLLERLLIHNNLLLSFCGFIRYNAEKNRLSLTSLLHHLLEFIAIDIRRLAHFPHLAIAYNGIETLTAKINTFKNQLKKQLIPEIQNQKSQKQKQIYELLLQLEEYQPILQPQAELFAQEKAEFERQKQQWYQEQEALKRQQQAWLEKQKAQIRQQAAQLEIEKITVQRQQALLAAQPNSSSKEQLKSNNNKHLRWSPLLLLAMVMGILGGVQILPKASVSSQKNLSALAQNQPLERRLKSAQTLAMEASEAVGSQQPLPLTAWQEAQEKWQDAIAVLQEMPERKMQSDPVQKQLAVYREDYNWASQKLIQEQTAIANFNSAKKFALEASVIAKKTSLPLEVWQQAYQKWQSAISLLETIPNDSYIAPKVQEKIAFYRLNSQEIEKRIYMQKQADQKRQTKTGT
ncbi:MAG: hypothetical protein AAFO04_01800 [Cyanobacteria bacterium J06592_8]